MEMLWISVVFALLSLKVAACTSGDMDEHWEKFKVAYNKSYSQMEDVERKKVFVQHVNKIFHHNLEADLGVYTYRVGLNEFADLTTEEFTKMMNGFRRSNTSDIPSVTFNIFTNLSLPEAIDWRQEGLVTYVKNQKQCGSCWAFSATGALEGQNKKKTGRLVSLSEQNLIDCAYPEGNYGCNGGWPSRAFEYVKLNNGIDTEDSYPYTAVNGQCHYNVKGKGASCTGYVNLASGNEVALQQAVAMIGPISVAIDASKWSFQMYKNGVYNELQCTTNQLDHAVLAVGYGTQNGNQYWLVKNSWGASWGENGYIKMSRNRNNQCGIATAASYPTM